MVAKNDTLASQPELNSSAEGESKNAAKRFSRDECAVVEPDSKREPVEPKICEDDAIRSAKPARAAVEVVIDK
jgi:hypothetical protein